MRNFAIFDLFDVLADGENVLRAEFCPPDNQDSHPNEMANKVAAVRFLEFFKPLWNEWQQGTAVRD